MSRHPQQDQWNSALRREFSECVAYCLTATPTYSEPDPWNRCTVFLDGIVKTQPERIAALDRDDLTTVLMSGSQAAKTAAIGALQHASPDILP